MMRLTAIGLYAVLGMIAGSAFGQGASDFNGDGITNRADVDLLSSEVFAGTNSPAFDLTGDGVVDGADTDQWLATAGALHLDSGQSFLRTDGNLDGRIDAIDFALWTQNKFTQNELFSAMDVNVDGVVDGIDFVNWNSQRFTQQGSVSSIAEPLMSTSASPGMAGDGVPDLFFDDATGLLDIDLDGGSLVALIVEGPDGLSVDWADGTSLPGSTPFDGATLTQSYIGGAENWVVTNPLIGVQFLEQQYTINQYIEGASFADFGDVTVVLDDGSVFTTRIVPAPSSAALLALGGLAAARRRRG